MAGVSEANTHRIRRYSLPKCFNALLKFTISLSEVDPATLGSTKGDEMFEHGMEEGFVLVRGNAISETKVPDEQAQQQQDLEEEEAEAEESEKEERLRLHKRRRQ
jgi:hypothetical protein